MYYMSKIENLSIINHNNYKFLLNFFVKDRFLRYVTVDTQSNPLSDTFPSTEKQKNLAKILVDELREMGILDAHLDEYGYVYATPTRIMYLLSAFVRTWIHLPIAAEPA